MKKSTFVLLSVLIIAGLITLVGFMTHANDGLMAVTGLGCVAVASLIRRKILT